MALCINDSGTWRDITTQCVNDSGTWRNIGDALINQSGTWRQYGFGAYLGASYEGGFVICKTGGTAWILAPVSTDVRRCWQCRTDAVTVAQSVTGCTGWFVPSLTQLQNPGFVCRTYWDTYSTDPSGLYWSNTEYTGICGYGVFFFDGSTFADHKTFSRRVRAFRCVSY